MPQQRQILKNFNLFVDGKGFAGVVEEFTPPKLAVQTDDFRAGGMDSSVPIDMGMEKLECSFILSNYDADVLALFGFLPGLPTVCTARGAIEDELGIITPAIHAMTGRIREIDPGTWKPGERSSMTVTMDLTRYAFTFGGRETVVIDVPNMIRSIGGIDRNLQLRAALGL